MKLLKTNQDMKNILDMITVLDLTGLLLVLFTNYSMIQLENYLAVKALIFVQNLVAWKC